MSEDYDDDSSEIDDSPAPDTDEFGGELVDFEEDDFDEDFDDDFEEEVAGEYDLDDDEYGEEFHQTHDFDLGELDDSGDREDLPDA
jgi:hypothetical protein